MSKVAVCGKALFWKEALLLLSIISDSELDTILFFIEIIRNEIGKEHTKT